MILDGFGVALEGGAAAVGASRGPVEAKKRTLVRPFSTDAATKARTFVARLPEKHGTSMPPDAARYVRAPLRVRWSAMTSPRATRTARHIGTGSPLRVGA